jgi:diguanylate cyclase (GGDEF)-like protein
MKTTVRGWTAFRDHVQRAIDQASQTPFALMVIDLDRFRAVNDSWGYSRGSEILDAMADRVREGIAGGDVFAHLGGDEFALMVSRCGDPDTAHEVAERLHRSLVSPFAVGGHQVFLSVSIGIVLSRERHETPEECLRAADAAMYRAKGLGHGNHLIFDQQLERGAVDRNTLEHDLRGAIARRELRLHYQPVVDFETGAIEGFEALVRWQHPKHGLLSPDSFIPVAEETGLVVPLGWMVLEEACQQLAEWQRQTVMQPFVSVNVSGRQFSQPDVVSRVERILARTGCRADRLRLELTETTVLEHDRDVVDRLVRLSDLGIRLYIDDFGTGYSSLSYLHQLPTHAIKIDRSFVKEVTGAPEIVGTIVNLARSLDMDVEAEGIETDGQLACLRRLGCTSGQGFYFSKPVTPLAAGTLIQS